MAVLLVVSFLCFALFLALGLRPSQWGPAQPRIRPAFDPGSVRYRQSGAAIQPQRPARHRFERPEPETPADWLYWLSGPSGGLTIRQAPTDHAHTPGCAPGHSGHIAHDSGTYGVAPSSCSGHSPGSHGH